MTDPVQALVVEDDPVVCKGVLQALDLAGITARGFDRAESALALLDAGFGGVLVCDVRLPGMDGLACLAEVQRRDGEIPVILMTGHGGISMAVQAMREGAYDFIEKPFTSDRLCDVVRRGLDRRRLVLENRRLKEQVLEKKSVFLLGDSAPIQHIRRMVAAIGPTEADVLIYGETGTGKEVVARALHAASGRSGEFVAINCAALPESVFESEIFGHEAGAFTGALKRRIGKIEFARAGTLFLDEIENMSPQLQVKLLRVLQERVVERLGSNQAIPVDCRIIAASKADLKALSDAGEFRADLYYRLNVVCLELPPLRARKSDIAVLAAHFLIQAASRYHCPAPALGGRELEAWMAHDWPGNVRELRNAVDRFCLGVVAAEPMPQAGGAGLVRRVDLYERQLIEAALRSCGGNVSAAAELLEIPRKTLYDRINRHGLVPEDFRGA
ncbi:sigma-54-dependent transcriptional regulator [Cognatazoarcus halotolerans]|uniref:sigma-54-dependent transcriptional regulator n=1 Tax=Cognatazoarcus halotolerans TaxID=2686016 RepID=UPI0013596D37|nr:sigma-54 dependent transcriptional regulator [Cognatazoarcus halotolerans]MCB1900577.1 sigma-54-dependent Fis family transcriptional regulator [Rhodocyclaceae bacterium]MCP5310571.1 sigma-54-dependent Fis family transcriptional regulator [Zoogloeaceae bacterium]